MKEVNREGTNNYEIDKFNIYFLKDVKTQGNQIAAISDNEIEFTLGNKYTFNNNCIFINDSMKIAESIESCRFSTGMENGKQIVYVTIKSKSGAERTIEYILNDETNDLAYFNNETNYTHGMLLYNETPKNNDGTLTANATYIEEGNIAIIPKGFKVSDVAEEQSIENGLVIQDEEGNEFVWIPVNYEVQKGEEKNASGLYSSFLKIFYRSSWNTDNDIGGKRGLDLTNDSSYTEPYKSGYKEENIEYNAMIKSVQENKGFYIGRYEAGTEMARTNSSAGEGKMVIKRDKYPYNFVAWGSDMNNIDDVIENSGHGAVYMCKHFYDEKDIGAVSTLCYGIQWDAMLDFIKSKDRDIANSTTWGNYKDNNWTITNQNAKYSADSGKSWNNISDELSKQKSNDDTTGMLLSTGASDDFAAKNIYDVAGNCWEWTMEAASSDKRVYRGR